MLTLIQTGVPARRGGQLYRLQMCTTYLGFLLAYLAAPGLSGWFGLRPVIMVAGLLTVAYGRLGIALFAVWPLRRTPQRVTGRGVEGRSVVTPPALLTLSEAASASRAGHDCGKRLSGGVMRVGDRFSSRANKDY